ncbi:hypothetical protein WCX72_02355 [Sulfurimonas sp. HSL1-6]|uniref:hypothetical protein n=1 Tax=Thiomicrolovo immobilis TaxID=3131935 RepID=UPI0031F92C5F
MTLNLLFITATALFIIAVLKQLLETNAFLNRLRDHHPSRYEAMGRPRWNIQFGDPRFREAVKYIRAHKFADLGDDELERIYKAIKRADRVAIASAVVAILITLIEVMRAAG